MPAPSPRSHRLLATTTRRRPAALHTVGEHPVPAMVEGLLSIRVRVLCAPRAPSTRRDRLVLNPFHSDTETQRL
jgi:hypothetical protein